jgi:hypothetical protein
MAALPIVILNAPQPLQTSGDATIVVIRTKISPASKNPGFSRCRKPVECLHDESSPATVLPRRR